MNVSVINLKEIKKRILNKIPKINTKKVNGEDGYIMLRSPAKEVNPQLDGCT